MRDPAAQRRQWIGTALVFAAGTALFLAIVRRASTDIQLHAEFIARCIENRFFPVDFLYYLGVAALAGFRPEPAAILFVSALVLAVALAAKFHLSARCAARWLSVGAPDGEVGHRVVLLGALGLAVLFCLPLPGQHWYLGQFPPNQWHNSTNIAVMPFAVLLFFHASRFLQTGEARWIGGVTLFTILNLVTKPSLFFSFALVFPVYALLRWGLARRFWLSCLPVVIGGLLLALYYLSAFHNPFYRELMQAQGVSLSFGFLQPWREYSSNIPLSIVNSLLWPLLVLARYPHLLRTDTAIRLAAALLGVGLAIFAFVTETGDRALHGNLSWQNVTANYLLHLAVLVGFLRQCARAGGPSGYDRFLVVVFVAQVLSGLVYIGRLIVTGDYV